MTENEVFYFEVAVATDPTWKQFLYSYAAAEKIALHTIVIVPFGATNKTGVVMRSITKPKFATKHIAAVLPLTLPETVLTTVRWLSEFYPASEGAHLQHYLPSHLKAVSKQIAPTQRPKSELAIAHSPTKAQQNAINTILSNTSKTSVLYGITGSGKTTVYIALCKQALLDGKNVILLYPEISLTTQITRTFSDAFGKDKVHVYHSRQTPSQQRATWITAAQESSGHIFMGPRSVLFLPFHEIGLLIIDEAHDAAYKEGSGTRYNGIMIASYIAKLHNARLVLGSATPPIQETQQLLEKGGTLVRLDELAIKNTIKKEFSLVDMTNKANVSNVSYLLSKKLLQSIEESLKQGTQSLLFLNRKGTSRLLLCTNCGWHATCGGCDMPLTFHHDSFTTQCSVCGSNSSVPTSCEECSAPLVQKTPGIKAVAQDIAALFPHANIARFDSTNKKQDSFSENFKKVHDGEVDIVIGTQLITKGIDLPHLTTVGILQAESALHMPDYTSEERAFQQLVQVSGRVGRGHNPNARVIIQAYDVQNPLFTLVKNQDWLGFYEYQLQLRKLHGYPPYSYMMKIVAHSKTSDATLKKCDAVCRRLMTEKGLTVLGPAPSFYHKKAGAYYWQLIVKSSSRKQLVSIARNLPDGFVVDLDPVSLL